MIPVYEQMHPEHRHGGNRATSTLRDFHWVKLIPLLVGGEQTSILRVSESTVFFAVAVQIGGHAERPPILVPSLRGRCGNRSLLRRLPQSNLPALFPRATEVSLVTTLFEGGKSGRAGRYWGSMDQYQPGFPF